MNADRGERSKEAPSMIYAGLDLSRKRLDYRCVDPAGGEVAVGALAPDRDGLARLVHRVGARGESVVAVIESMNGARFVHDQLELAGWDVRIADARRAKALAPLACKTDRIDAWVLSELARRDLVPEIWLPDPEVRAERERARFRLHLVRHRTALKNRIHATLIAHGHQCPTSDLFGREGRRRLQEMAVPAPWAGTLGASLALIDHLDAQIDAVQRELCSLGLEHPDMTLLRSIPGVGTILAYTIASELGDIGRFASPAKLAGYTGLCPRVDQSGERDWRGPVTKNGPRYLRWALIEAAQHTACSPHYRELYRRTRRRLGRQRGPKVAAVVVARKLAEAIWWMLTRRQPFAPAGATLPLTA
jgi:transposase